MSNLLVHVLSFASLHPAITGVFVIVILLVIFFAGLFNTSYNKYYR